MPKPRPCAHAVCPEPAEPRHDYCRRHASWVDAQLRWDREHPKAEA